MPTTPKAIFATNDRDDDDFHNPAVLVHAQHARFQKMQQRAWELRRAAKQMHREQQPPVALEALRLLGLQAADKIDSAGGGGV